MCNISRIKGFITFAGSEYINVFHSVGMLFSCVPFKNWDADEPREGVFVIIDKHLEQKGLQDRFKKSATQEIKVLILLLKIKKLIIEI